MSVVCTGNSRILEQLGDKQDFESELSRVGFRHEEFTLQVDHKNTRRSIAGWDPQYQVKVTHAPTQTVKVYEGGPRKKWLARFAADLSDGLYGEPTFTRVGISRRQPRAVL
jgi:hypothetical protein